MERTTLEVAPLSRIALPAALVALVLASALPTALAQDPSVSREWHGQDTEFGRIRMPYQAEMQGEPIPIEARIVLQTHYTDQDGTYFLFAWDVSRQPFDVRFDKLMTASGSDIKVLKTESGDGQEKWFVDIKNMPPPGTEIVMKGTLGATTKGLFPAGALVVPFNYRWEPIDMSNGVPATLYAFTQVGVNEETRSVGWSFPLAKIPGFEIPLAAAAIGVALVAARRRRA
ncbi:MAG TPA: hypothetical protein VM889_14560 [Candidatus Thermoplasmatota archaeon]|nr:hypothetical protein [Candidatus Thermoplasmatota archaeon]